MRILQFDHGLLEQFRQAGSTMQVSNFGSAFVAEAERFLYEGELDAIDIEGSTLTGRYKWLAKKNLQEDRWQLEHDPSLQCFSMSLQLFQAVHTPDPGRLVFFPLEPVGTEQVLLIAGTYCGPTGRRPLSRAEVTEAV